MTVCGSGLSNGDSITGWAILEGTDSRRCKKKRLDGGRQIKFNNIYYLLAY